MGKTTYRVGKGQTDLLGWVDDEHSSDLSVQHVRNDCLKWEDREALVTYGERKALLVDVGGVLLVKHVVQHRDLAVGIGNLRAKRQNQGRSRSTLLV